MTASQHDPSHPDATAQDAAREPEMDMTPMVDVTFLLLIFFMVTAAFALQKAMETPVPEDNRPSSRAAEVNPLEDVEYVTVTIDQYNTYSVICPAADMDGEEAPSRHELLRLLRETREVADPPTKLLVQAHSESFHEKVVAALDAGTEIGMEQIQVQKIDDLDN